MTSKRKYLIQLIIILMSIVSVNAQWKTEKSPTRNNLNSVSVIDSNAGWIVGEEGIMLYKSGDVWKEYQKSLSEDLNSVFMIEKNNGWAVGANGTILHFNGNNWEPLKSPTSNDLLSVSFKDPENGIAVGEYGTILLYQNGSWNLIESGIRGSFYSASYYKDVAWIGGGLECVNIPIMELRFDKNGNRIVKSFDPYASIYSIVFLNTGIGWAVGSPSTLLHFDGQKWEQAFITEKFSSLRSICFSDEYTGISVGYGGTVLIYNGNKWIKENPSTNENLRGCSVAGSIYYAVGDKGTIISMKLTESNNLTTIPEKRSGEIKIFPNPCDDILNIELPLINVSEYVLISIINETGQIIKQKKLYPGNGNLTYPFVTSELENGLYLLKTVTDSETNSIKFIIKH